MLKNTYSCLPRMGSLNNLPEQQAEPLFADYIADKPRLTYAQPGDSALRQWMITQFEFALGRKN